VLPDPPRVKFPDSTNENAFAASVFDDAIVTSVVNGAIVTSVLSESSVASAEENANTTSMVNVASDTSVLVSPDVEIAGLVPVNESPTLDPANSGSMVTGPIVADVVITEDLPDINVAVKGVAVHNIPANGGILDAQVSPALPKSPSVSSSYLEDGWTPSSFIENTNLSYRVNNESMTEITTTMGTLMLRVKRVKTGSR